MLLEGRIAIITGAGSERGLGRATAKLFAENGATVIVSDVDGDMAADAAANLAGDGHLSLACNIAEADDCARLVRLALARYERIDVLVNNAGIVQSNHTLDISEADFDKIIGVNLHGTLLMSQAVLPTMQAQKAGSIVNMASVAGQRGGGILGGPHYAASKAGVQGLTRAMAREFAPDGIRVNAVAPSLVDTGMTEVITDARRKALLGSIPLGRAGTAEEVAGCILFLASDLSTYVTGTTLDVNGGSHIH